MLLYVSGCDAHYREVAQLKKHADKVDIYFDLDSCISYNHYSCL